MNNTLHPLKTAKNPSFECNPKGWKRLGGLSSVARSGNHPLTQRERPFRRRFDFASGEAGNGCNWLKMNPRSHRNLGIRKQRVSSIGRTGALGAENS
jgi:hypothetical protein